MLCLESGVLDSVEGYPRLYGIGKSLHSVLLYTRTYLSIDRMADTPPLVLLYTRTCACMHRMADTPPLVLVVYTCAF